MHIKKHKIVGANSGILEGVIIREGVMIEAKTPSSQKTVIHG